jgi:uncharacterized protein YbaP (TraB family)
MATIDDLLVPGRDLLIVVGAGHLVGEEGLVELLQDRGFRIRQL